MGICIKISSPSPPPSIPSSPPPPPREEEVSSCQDQLAEFRSAAGALTTWLEETDRKVPAPQPSSSSTQSLEQDLLSLNVSRPHEFVVETRRCPRTCLDYRLLNAPSCFSGDRGPDGDVTVWTLAIWGLATVLLGTDVCVFCVFVCVRVCLSVWAFVCV